MSAWTGLRPDGSPYETSAWFAVYASHIRGYMRRWIVRVAGYTLRLHNIERRDFDDDCHDHPFDFTSLVLRGGYRERRQAPDGMASWRWRCPGDVARFRSEDLHCIVAVLPGTWTLVVTGPKRRSWGYATSRGWVGWREYHGVGS